MLKFVWPWGFNNKKPPGVAGCCAIAVVLLCYVDVVHVCRVVVLCCCVTIAVLMQNCVNAMLMCYAVLLCSIGYVAVL